MLDESPEKNPEETLGLVTYFCRSAQLRLEKHFQGIRHNLDRTGYRMTQAVLAGKYEWLEHGIVKTTHESGPPR